MNNRYIVNKIKNIDFDYILSVNNHLIFNDKYLSDFRDKIINYHNSLIPSFKGLYSISKAIISGQSHTGITWHFVRKKIDDGPVIFSKSIRILNKDTAASLTLKCNSACIKYIDKFFKILKKKKIIFRKKKSKDFKLSNKILHLNKNLKISRLHRIIRAFDYYPFQNKFGYPFIYFNKKKIFVRKIIHHSRDKRFCQRYVNRDCELVKFSKMYVVFKKVHKII